MQNTVSGYAAFCTELLCSLVCPAFLLRSVSGGGKSTIMGLIERFYDCDNGAVFAGKEQVDIRELNVRWWREQIGYVKQVRVVALSSLFETLTIHMYMHPYFFFK